MMKLKLTPLTIILTTVLVSSCLKMAPDEEIITNSPSNSTIAEPTKTSSVDIPTSKRPTTVSQVIDTYMAEGGVLDLRSKSNFILRGSYDQNKLMRTIITLRGDGDNILRTTSANSFAHGSTFYLGGDYEFIQVEESYNGKTLNTKFPGTGDIRYRLKL